MKTLIRLEGLALFGLSIFLFARLDYAWWWYPVLFFVPDLSMVGYLGFLVGLPVLQLAGVILLGHSNLDRMLGYGLKHSDSFQNTHLGVIGK